MKINNAPLSLLWKYAGRHRARVALLACFYAASTALFIFAPQMLQAFIDAVYGGAAWSATLLAILLYLAAVLARTGMSALLNVQLAATGQHITDSYRRDVLGHYLALDLQRLSGWTSGEAITRLDEDVQGLFQYYYILFFKLLGSGLALAAILVLLALRSGWLCAALLLVSGLSILGFKAIEDRGIPKYVRSAAAAASFNGRMKELLDNAVTLRALHAEDYAETTLRGAMRARFQESLPARLMYGNLWSASTLMQGAVVATGLLFALLLWDAGTITLGMAYLIYTYSEMIIEPLQDFRNHMGDMQGAKAGILRTQEMLDTPVMPWAGVESLPDSPPAVSVEGLSFAYAGGADVLRGVGLSLRPGKRLGIMGESGCGKSTLLGLLARLNPCDRGVIRLDDHALDAISSQSFRGRVAYCTQRVQLLHGTLRDNITLFDPQTTDADVLAAVRALDLSAWFAKFPEGLDTQLTMGKDSLSSGEAQLVTLIRLALRRPRLVLLDEITANLDAATERHVLRAVEALCEGCTVIAVAHSRQALDWMDTIAIMENGVLKGGCTDANQ